MPTYEYACTACRERLEVVQRIADDPLSVCPSCGGALRKVFSPVGVVFKGSGFYRTDSRTTSSTKSGENGKSADKPSTTSKESSSTESSTSSSKGTASDSKGASTSSTSTTSSGKVA